MADRIGGYQRPTASAYVSDTFQGHKNRTLPSQEPGTDYGVPYGSVIYAAEDGVIADLKVTNSYATGRYVTIDLNDGYRVRYLHLSKVLVVKGQKVKRGQQVAVSGASANGSDWGVGAHVHTTLWPEHRYTVGVGNKCIDF